MKRRILVSFAVSCFTISLLNAEVHAPKVGIARYADSSVHAVYGVDSAFVVDSKTLASADVISFSDSGGLLSSNGHIQLVDSTFAQIAEYDSGEKAPLLNISDLSSAIAWLPSQQAVIHWNGQAFAVTHLSGTVLNNVSSVSFESPNFAKLLFSDADSVSEAVVSLNTGNIISTSVVPGMSAPAFQHGSFVLSFDNNNSLQIQKSNSVRTILIHAPDLTFERIASDWVHLSSPTTGQNWALHLNNRVADLSELPGPPARATLQTTQETAK